MTNSDSIDAERGTRNLPLARRGRAPRTGLATSLLLASMLWAALPARAQIDKLPHPDTTRGNFFGAAVSVDRDRVLVGASSEDTCAEDAGAAHIYERDASTRTWRRVAHLLPEDCAAGLFFGRSVALSGDRAIVASTRSYFASALRNAAYVFERDSTGEWRQRAKLTARGEDEEGPAGASVSLVGDRALLTTWGDTAEGRYGGAAYVFEYDPDTKEWREAARLTGSGGIARGIFGGDAALGQDRLVVGSSAYFEQRPGSIYIFERSPEGIWSEAARIGDIDDFFISVDIDNDHILVGESREGRGQSGLATLYARDASGQWRLRETLQPPTPYRHGGFGSEVALSGDRALVVGYDEQLRLDYNIDRVVYVYAFDPESATWAYQGIIDIGNVAFGSAVDLDHRVAVIGAAADESTGAAYVVRLH